MELFTNQAQKVQEPLASRMRPRTLSEYIGQEHIIGPGRLLRRAIKADQLTSIILYGPPGTGKTTLARVIANTTKSHFITINAVLSGVKEIRETIKKSREIRDLYNQKTILFVDEVHRWNKSQQDALLPCVENGLVIFIGATIENPFFEVNRALISRSRIFQLKPLSNENLISIAKNAISDTERGYGNLQVKIENEALSHLVHVAAGDARSLLNALQLAVETTPEVFPPSKEEILHITLPIAEQSIQKKAVLYDKEGDYHFDIISAFIKSLRGSDPDAALYWLANMIYAGEDPHFIFRRMLILASEDVGMADPHALPLVNAAASAFERVGLPEGCFHLAHAALYLSTCQKSNSTLSFYSALEAVKNGMNTEVPNHLKDTSRDKMSFGHGEGYLYPHAFKDHWAPQQYLPSSLQGKVFYKPGITGYESEIKEIIERRREAQLSAMSEQDAPEIYTYSPPQVLRDKWFNRVMRSMPGMLMDLRDEIFSPLNIKRHDRILVGNLTGGLLLWEAVRRTPEGGVVGISSKKKQIELQAHYFNFLKEIEKPTLIAADILAFTQGGYEQIPDSLFFDIIIGKNILTEQKDKKLVFNKLFDLIDTSGYISLAEIIPAKSPRLSGFLIPQSLPQTLFTKIINIEESLYSSKTNPLVNWNESDIPVYCREAGFKNIKQKIKSYKEYRILRNEDITRWTSTVTDSKESYGRYLKDSLSDEEFEKVVKCFKEQLSDKTVEWKYTFAFITAQKK